jgi:tartrate-resistant acid phosphatase type 5
MLLATIFTAKMQAHGVDLYINGHDHCLQHISSRDRSASQ